MIKPAPLKDEPTLDKIYNLANSILAIVRIEELRKKKEQVAWLKEELYKFDLEKHGHLVLAAIDKAFPDVVDDHSNEDGESERRVARGE